MLASIMLFLLAPITTTDQWSKTFDTSGQAAFRVRTSDANIHVKTWDRNAIEAVVSTVNWKIGDSGILILDQQTGDEVSLEVKFPRTIFSINFRTRRVDITVRVPRNTRLDLRTGDGNIEVIGSKGSLVARTGDGNLRIVDIEGDVLAHTGDGRIDVRGVKGEITLETGDGNTTIENVEGRLRASAGDGDIRAVGRFDVLEIKTGDGRIEASALQGSRMSADWRLTTGDGSLTLRLPQEFDAEVDLRTSDGHIDLSLPVTISGRAGASRIRGRINAGGSLLTLKTGDGSIRLEKL
ncbi:MAG: DUF4097 family beta strand repeat-containing protein [Acidobacteriota bacterium]